MMALSELSDIPAFVVIALFAMFGSFVGSFTNVVVYRLPRNCLSVNNPKRSFCPSCKTQLKAADNIPILGWVFLGGKCRYCGTKYGIRYPLVEALVAALFGVTAWVAFYSTGENMLGDWHAWVFCAHTIGMVCVLVPWALIDLDLTYIPHRLTFGPMPFFLALSWHWQTYQFGMPRPIDPFVFDFAPIWLNSSLSAVATGVAGMLILRGFGLLGNVLFAANASKEGGESMGLGDVTLMALLGLMLGWPKLAAAFVVAIFVGSIVGVTMRLVKSARGVAFGPYLAIGALSAQLAAEWLFRGVDWYIEFLQNLMQ